MRATWIDYLNVDLITLIVFGPPYKLFVMQPYRTIQNFVLLEQIHEQ